MDAGGVRHNKEMLARLFLLVQLVAAAAVLLSAYLIRQDYVLLRAAMPEQGGWMPSDLNATAGEPLELRNQPLRFSYEEAFGPLPGAYETLLLDVLQGDQTLFVHAEEVEASWRLYAPVLEADLPVHGYRAGSWGPAEADRLLPEDGSGDWRTR